MKVINEWNGCSTCNNTKELSKIKLNELELLLCKGCKKLLGDIKGGNMENIKCMFCKENIGTNTIDTRFCDKCFEYNVFKLLKLGS